MATRQQPWPRNAEYARLEAIEAARAQRQITQTARDIVRRTHALGRYLDPAHRWELEQLAAEARAAIAEHHALTADIILHLTEAKYGRDEYDQAA